MPRIGWLAIGAVAGSLVLAHVGGGWPAAIVALAAGGAGLAGVAGRRRWLALMALGAVLLLARGVALAPAGEPTGPTAGYAGEQLHRGTVVTLYAPSGGMQRALLELEPAAEGVSPSRVYANLPRYPPIAPTQSVVFDGRLEPAPPASESGFAEFLARSGVSFTVRARMLELVAGDDTPQAGLEHVRRAAGDSLARRLPEPQAGLAGAILVGLRDLVARDVASDFRIAGLSHVVAISGFHVALVAGLAGVLLRPLAHRPRSLALICLLGSYALLAGASPSVLRATLMAGTVLLVRESGRRSQAAAALALAVLALLLVEPATIHEVGFQLSVAATAGLLHWAGPFGEWLARRAPAIVPRWLVETLAVSLSAQLATLPLVLLHFGRLSLVAPLSNLLAAPVIAPAMGTAGAALAAGGLAAAGLPEVLLAPVELAGALALGALIAIARLCAALPMASIQLAAPLDLLGATLAAGVVLLLARRRAPGGTRPATVERGIRRPSPRRGLRPLAAVAAGAAVLILLLALVGQARPDGRLHMTVLEIGQGDAILLIGPAGSRMLVDTGPDPDLLLAQLDSRLPAWDRRIDLVVVTHPHEDHVAGLALLLDRYRIGEVAEPGMIGLGPGDVAFRRRLAEMGRTTRLLAAGDRFDFDGVAVVVHWPLPGRVPLRPADSGRAVNNVSIVLELAFGERRLLLTGDVEQEIDAQLLAVGIGAADGRPLDVLKVAHHGSGSATTDAFVERLRPQVAVVSAGWANPYGHPSAKTVARLEQAGARVLRTDVDGAVHLSTDGHDLLVETGGARPRPSRLPRADALPPGLGFCPLPASAEAGRRRRRWRPYNRPDGHPHPRRRGAPADRAAAAGSAAAPLDGSCRSRRLPGRPRRCPRRHGRPRPGRNGSPAA